VLAVSAIAVAAPEIKAPVAPDTPLVITPPEAPPVIVAKLLILKAEAPSPMTAVVTPKGPFTMTLAPTPPWIVAKLVTVPVAPTRPPI
jgi:hypothetical protein